MKASDRRAELLSTLQESLCQDDDIRFAVVFGSQVTDDWRPSSDFDLAVKFADRLSSHERFLKRCYLSGDLQQEDAPFVDISDIEDLPIEVAHDAVSGELLCGDTQTFRQFKADVEQTFAEQRDDIRRHQRSVIDRIAEDGLRG